MKWFSKTPKYSGSGEASVATEIALKLIANGFEILPVDARKKAHDFIKQNFPVKHGDHG